jgi:hypothetical protein
MGDTELLLELLQTLQREIREQVVAACSSESVGHLSSVADDGPGDTIYRIDKVSEAVLLCFEDQYASTGGQLYELIVGHDRFNADLRPLLRPLLEQRGQTGGLCCHPYDLCTTLIATEAGVIVTDAAGQPLDMPLDVGTDVAWVGYANPTLRDQIEPVLLRVLARRGLSAAELGRAAGEPKAAPP